MEPTDKHDKFEEIYQAKQALSPANVIAALAAQACENFLLDGKRLEVVTFAKDTLDGENKQAEGDQEHDTKGNPGSAKRLPPGAKHSLASFPAGCNLSAAALAVCQDDACALSLFAASRSTCTNQQRHYAADYVGKVLKSDPAYELCVTSPQLQAALFASVQSSTEQSRMFKVMYTPPDVAKQVEDMHSCCDGQAWNIRHPFTHIQGGVDAYSALCLAHPSIAASASYNDFTAEHPAVTQSLLTTEALFAAYRAGLMVCYALPSLNGGRGGLQAAVSMAASLVAKKNAGAAVHAVFNHCQYWLPVQGRGLLVAAAQLANDRYLILLANHHGKFAVQNVSTDEYNLLGRDWAQWYMQRLLFDMSCWVQYDSKDQAIIDADREQILEAITNKQKVELSSLGRTAFASCFPGNE